MTVSPVLCLFLCFVLSSGKLTLLGNDNPTKIDGHFIVIYNDDTTQEEATAHVKGVSTTAQVKYVYNIGNTFKGFSAQLNNSMVDLLLEDPLVKEVHCDGMETIVENSCDSTQANAPSWGIARVSHKGSIEGGLRDDYYYDSDASGLGVAAYVLDTGIYIAHNDFRGRAIVGANFVDSVATDENGHGTHCAGTIGGATFGIAKAVRLVAVKVLGRTGSGATSGVIAGIDWVTRQHSTAGLASVASMSLGSTTDGGKNAAITASVRAGVTYSVSAGNSNADACNHYPASCPDAITVGSTQISNLGDARSSFSNYGECVTLFAPGSTITSCGITGPNSSTVKSGTSMACPHVTGVVAVLLGQNPTMTPVQVKSRLLSMAQKELINNPGFLSPNALLYNECDEAMHEVK